MLRARVAELERENEDLKHELEAVRQAKEDEVSGVLDYAGSEYSEALELRTRVRELEGQLANSNEAVIQLTVQRDRLKAQLERVRKYLLSDDCGRIPQDIFNELYSRIESGGGEG